MVVTRYIRGKEIPLSELKKIKLTDNPDILQLVDRVIDRVNRDAENREISTKDVPA